MAATCCLNLSPPTPRSSNSSSSSSSSSSMASRTVQVPWNRNRARSGSRPGAAARVAMVVIGLVEMGNSFMGAGEIAEAVAGETLEMAAPEDRVAMRIARWSEKRSCPPWRLNSLETIVPENLPRPHAHRRSESVGFSDHRDAPALEPRVAKSNPRCFSM